MPLFEALFLLDRLTASKKREHEERMSEYQTLLNISVAPHSKDGAQSFAESLKSQMYIHRKRIEKDVKPDSQALTMLNSFKDKPNE